MLIMILITMLKKGTVALLLMQLILNMKQKRHYSHIDCPGHQQYVKNMLTGAVQMEGAILVVAVNDGPQVQTREHIILAKEVGIPYLIIYINKLDLMLEGDMKDLVELEVRELLDSYGFLGDVPCIKGSARTALEESDPSSIRYRFCKTINGYSRFLY